MKILLIGFIAFSAWAAFSTHIFVCNIKGLCDDPVILSPVVVSNNVHMADTSIRASVQEQPAIPEKLITYFAFDKSDFVSDQHSGKFFDDSKAYIDKNPMAELTITGYTDSVGSDKYNLDLGFRRAKSMQAYFESKGLATAKIITASIGEKEPADNNSTANGRANNRRAEISIKKQSHE
jgi:outer membrane protein OmpA-like peptidoglycan-associated protein